MPTAPWWRRALPVAVVVTVIGVAAVATAPAPPPDGTAGRADLPPDLVATRPLPIADLALAWEHASREPPMPGFSAPTIVTVTPIDEVDRLVAVGPLVVDLDRGEVVGRRPFGLVAGDGRVLLGDGAELESWDVASGEQVDSVTVDGLRPEESVSVRHLFADGDVLATVCCAAGRFRHVRIGPDGAAVSLPTFGDANPATTLGDELVAVVRDARVAWLHATTGQLIAQVGPAADGGPLVDVGTHVARAVDDRLLAVDASGALDDVAVEAAGGLLDQLAVIGRIGDRLVVAGSTEDDATWRRVVTIAAPPWSGPSTPVLADLTAVVPPTPRVGREVALGTPAGIRAPGDATVAGDLVVVNDVAAGVVRAVSLDGGTRWSVPAAEDVTVAGVLDHVVVASRVGQGTRAQLLSAADGSERWAGIVSPEPSPPRLVAVHERRFLLADGQSLDARSGETASPVGPAVGLPLGVVPAADGEGTVVVGRRPAGDRVIVRWGDREVALEAGADGQRPEVRGLAGDTLITSLPVLDDDAVRVRLELVAGDGTTTVVAADGSAVIRYGRLVDEPVVRRGGSAVLLDPVTGEDELVVTGASGLDRVADDRLVALGQLDWWVVESDEGEVLGDRWNLPLGQPALGDALVATTSTDGTVTVVDAVDGAVAWRAEGPAAPSTTVFAGAQLLVGTHDGRVVAFDEAGSRVAELDAGEGPVEALAWEAGTLLVTVDGAHRGFREDGTGVVPDAVDLP